MTFLLPVIAGVLAISSISGCNRDDEAIKPDPTPPLIPKEEDLMKHCFPNHYHVEDGVKVWEHTPDNGSIFNDYSFILSRRASSIWDNALKKKISAKPNYFQLETEIIKTFSVPSATKKPIPDPGLDFGDLSIEPERYVFQGRIYPDCSLGLSLHHVREINWPNEALYWGNVEFYAKFPSHEPNFDSLEGKVLDPVEYESFTADFGGGRPLMWAHKKINTLKIVRE